MTTNIENRDREWYERRVAYLSGFVCEQRYALLCERVGHRTDYMTICAENTFHPQNASALVRTCEAFGVQRISTIETLCPFQPTVNIVKGSDKWIDIERHDSTAKAIAALKGEGYRIIATTPHRDDTTPESFDVAAGPFALFFGTEHAGVSPEVMEAADGYIMIPMCGFVESLNVSASAAIVLYNLSQKIKSSPNIEWPMSSLRRAETLFRWLMATIKDADGVLSRYEEI